MSLIEQLLSGASQPNGHYTCLFHILSWRLNIPVAPPCLPSLMLKTLIMGSGIAYTRAGPRGKTEN